MLSKRNDQRNISYYMPYKLQQKVLSQIDFSKDKNILCINDWKSSHSDSLALFVVIFLRQLLFILKTIEINKITMSCDYIHRAEVVGSEMIEMEKSREFFCIGNVNQLN